MNETCVYIVDDDPAVRDALSILVRSLHFNPEQYDSADTFLTHYDPNQPGCLITDVCLPGIDGPTLQQYLIQAGDKRPIIVISGHGDIPLAVKMVRLGAIDFIEKPFRNHTVLNRIQEAVKLDRQQRNRIRDERDCLQHYQQLTPREKEVLEHLIEGTPNKVIAAKIAISPRTVETHRANILRKMQVDSVTCLTQKITRLRLSFN